MEISADCTADNFRPAFPTPPEIGESCQAPHPLLPKSPLPDRLPAPHGIRQPDSAPAKPAIKTGSSSGKPRTQFRHRFRSRNNPNLTLPKSLKATVSLPNPRGFQLRWPARQALKQPVNQHGSLAGWQQKGFLLKNCDIHTAQSYAIPAPHATANIVVHRVFWFCERRGVAPANWSTTPQQGKGL